MPRPGPAPIVLPDSVLSAMNGNIPYNEEELMELEEAFLKPRKLVEEAPEDGEVSIASTTRPIMELNRPGYKELEALQKGGVHHRMIRNRTPHRSSIC